MASTSPHTPPTLTTLPTELLLQILLYLPPSSLQTLRLTSHHLETLSFPLLFRNLPNWLDYKRSHAAIVALANDAFERPSGMWSPWASEPDGEVQGTWLGLLWRVETRGGFVLNENWGKKDGEEGEGEGVWVDGGNGEKVWGTARSYARLSGREDVNEKKLRAAQNRYLMHRNYSDGVGKKGLELKQDDGEEAGRSANGIEVRWKEKEL
ncbi:hypothetical protein ONS96_012473 [Cadophora gregata f. sp. sojae]|nr:hypothetical protein ONS96_012473 [Cadophora gregata f. sp. sojae]